MVFCNDTIRRKFIDGQCPAGPLPRHPSPLYEAALEGLGLFLLAYLVGRVFKQLHRPGIVMGAFITGYGLIRITLENFRQPDQGLENLPLGLTMGMYLSLPMVLGPVLVWAIYHYYIAPKSKP